MLLCTTNKKPGWHGHQGLRGAGPEQRLKTASDLKRPAQPIVALRRDSHRGSAPQESRFMPFVAELSDLPRRPLWEDALQDIVETSPGVRLWRFLTVKHAVLA